MEKTSCLAGEPLSKLDTDGKAAILNYNLPQATTYEVVSLVKLSVKPELFRAEARKPPAGNYWDRLDAVRRDLDLTPQRIQATLEARAYLPVDEVMNVGMNLASAELPTSSGVRFQAGNITVASRTTEFSTEYLANKISEGFQPVLYNRPSGKQAVRFVKRPREAEPAIYMVMRMRMASFLGDYGAGQTLSTFSLLPGEKSVIEIRDYRHNATTKVSSQSVLDSYSESSMEDLQSTVETRTSAGSSASETDTDAMSAEVGASGGINLGIVKLGGDAGADASSVNTTTEAVSNQVDTLNSAVSHHVQTADTQRQIEINTDVTTTEISETEVTTTRTLENINRSRVLNSVFRQLLQDYFTITYLENVSFLFTNGYDTSRKTGTLASLDNFLASVLDSREAIEAVRNEIYVQLCGIPDHTGTKVRFIEKVVEKATNCIEPGQGEREVSYVRKRRDLKQSYLDKTVDGVILDVTHRVLRTPSVIVDAVLGQGEALDCYNQHLQEAAFDGAHLANARTRQAIAVIDGIADPAEKARLYNHVFGTCCPTPQSAEEA